MPKHSIISEDENCYHVHDGKSHFLVAKKGLTKGLHEKIKSLPKYAEGGDVAAAQEVGDRTPSSFSLPGAGFLGFGQLADTVKNVAGSVPGAEMMGITPNPKAPPVADVVQAEQPNIQPEDNRQPAVNDQPVMPQPAAATPSPVMPNMMKEYKSAAQQEVQGIQNVANVQGKIAEEQAKAYQNQFPPEFENELKTRMTRLNEQAKKVEEELPALEKAAFQGTEDPGRIWHNMSTGNKVMATIGLILGGMGSGGNANNNAALNVLNQAIDRDIQAQRAAKSNSQNLYKANIDRLKDDYSAQELTRMQLNSVLQGKIAMAAAKLGTPLAQAEAQKQIGALRMQNMQIGQQVYQRQVGMEMMQTLNKSSANMAPEQKIRAMEMTGIIPKDQVGPVYKDLQDAQNLKTLHDEGLRVFDEVSKLNTLTNKLNPQARSKIQALEGAYLDRLTKDTSGRVTPQTVDLVGGLFKAALDNPSTVNDKRGNFSKFLLTNSAFPRLTAYGVNPINTMVYSRPANGVSKRK